MLVENVETFEKIDYLFCNKNSQFISHEIASSINNVDLIPELSYWVERLENMGGAYSHMFVHRTRYVWKWIQSAFHLTGLNIPNEHLKSSQSLKCRMGVLAVLLDDMCDVGQSEYELELGLSVLAGFIPSRKEDPIYQLIYDLWTSINRDLKDNSNYYQIQEEISDAIRKLVNSFRYSLSVQNNILSGEKIWDSYFDIIPHSICVYLAGLIDLLHVPLQKQFDLKTVRHLFENMQKMAQIGNWISTYEREIHQNDMSSGIIVFGLEKKLFDYRCFQQPMCIEDVKCIIKNSPVERLLFEIWKMLRHESLLIQKQCDESIFQGYVDSFSDVFLMQMGSIGST